MIALGSLGLCSVGTFFAAVAVRTRLREVMLPLLALPFYTPVLVAATRATNSLLETGSVSFEPIHFSCRLQAGALCRCVGSTVNKLYLSCHCGINYQLS